MFTRVQIIETIPFTRNFQFDFFIMQFAENGRYFSLKNVKILVRIFEIIWFGVVIELISSNWKGIATCADWYITDISSVARV